MITYLMKMLSITDQHPFILPTSHAGIIKDKNKLVVCKPYSLKGSLRDLIYKTAPSKKPFDNRYIIDKNGKKIVGHPIPIVQVQKYGAQILHVLGLGYSMVAHSPF